MSDDAPDGGGQVALRRAAVEDGEVLAELDAGGFARPWSRAQWHAELTRAHTRVLLLEDPNGRVFAYVCVWIVDDVAEIQRIATVMRSRRRGLARRLLDAVIEIATESGCRRVELEVASRNTAALALYEGASFRAVGRRPAYYRDPPDDALLLALDVGPR